MALNRAEIERVLTEIAPVLRGGWIQKIQQPTPHTLVFDEVDSGIGGKPAERVGRRLRDLASHHQVLCITHLPQIAAFAHQHVRVEKEHSGHRTLVRAKSLESGERVAELARMLAGEKIAETALLHAQELLRAAQF